LRTGTALKAQPLHAYGLIQINRACLEDVSAGSRNFVLRWENPTCEVSISAVVVGAIGALLMFALSDSKYARNWLTWLVSAMAIALLAGWYFTRGKLSRLIRAR
jgi:hypothetical protein